MTALLRHGSLFLRLEVLQLGNARKGDDALHGSCRSGVQFPITSAAGLRRDSLTPEVTFFSPIGVDGRSYSSPESASRWAPGIGLLLCSRLNNDQRKAAGMALALVGGLTTIR